MPVELPIDSPERRRLPPTLRKAWYGLNQALRRRISHLGLTPDQFTAMRILMEGDANGLPQRELADRMSSDPNTIASLLERMENAGWVERRPHEKDRRAYRIRLLASGKKTYQAARQIAVGLQEEILDVLPESSRETFLIHLSAIADACRHAAENSPRDGSAGPPSLARR